MRVLAEIQSVKDITQNPHHKNTYPAYGYLEVTIAERNHL